MFAGITSDLPNRYETRKSSLSLILWSILATAKCSLVVFCEVEVKKADRRPSPPEKSLGIGSNAHVAAIAGLTPIPRGSRPLDGTVAPVSGSVTALPFRL